MYLLKNINISLFFIMNSAIVLILLIFIGAVKVSIFCVLVGFVYLCNYLLYKLVMLKKSPILNCWLGGFFDAVYNGNIYNILFFCCLGVDKGVKVSMAWIFMVYLRG